MASAAFICCFCREVYPLHEHHEQHFCQPECGQQASLHIDFCTRCQWHWMTYWKAHWLVDRRMEKERKRLENSGDSP